MKDIYNKNDKTQLHGYQEWYLTNNMLWLRGVCKHSLWIGYKESSIISYIGKGGTVVEFFIR